MNRKTYNKILSNNKNIISVKKNPLLRIFLSSEYQIRRSNFKIYTEYDSIEYCFMIYCPCILKIDRLKMVSKPDIFRKYDYLNIQNHIKSNYYIKGNLVSKEIIYLFKKSEIMYDSIFIENNSKKFVIKFKTYNNFDNNLKKVINLIRRIDKEYN